MSKQELGYDGEGIDGTLLEIRYVPIPTAMRLLWDKNSKQHDIGAIITSIEQYGFRDALIYDAQLNDGKGGIAAGNGRLAAVAKMSELSMAVPAGIGVTAIDGEPVWCVPVQFGITAGSSEIASAFALDHNNIVLMGGDAESIFGQKQFSTHFVNQLWAQYNPDAAAAFVDAMVDSINWIEANQDAARPIISKYTDVDAEYVPVYHYQKDGAIIMDDIAFWLDFLVGRGDVEVDWLKPVDIANNMYNSKAQ